MGHQRNAAAIRCEEFVVDGLTTRAWSTAGEGRTFVLVHGIGMSHRYLMRLHRVLAESGAQVHTVDLPGFGGMPRPRRDLSVSAMADVLASMLSSLNLREPAVVVGQSMGAQWVVELAAQHPEWCEAVVLIGPVVDAERRTAWQQALALTVDTLRESPGANALVFADYLRCGIRWYAAQLHPMLTYPIEEKVAQLGAPVVVLRGGRDPVAGSRWARQLRAAARSGAGVVVPGHAHNVHFSAPRAVAAAIRAFCDDAGGVR